MCRSFGGILVWMFRSTVHIDQRCVIVLCVVQASVCLLSLLHDPNDAIKTTKVKVAASRIAICPSHKINCPLKFSIKAGGKKTKATEGPMASKQLVASQVTPPILPHPHPLCSYQANWRQALWDGHTMEPTVEWHLRLNGCAGEREMLGYSVSTPTHLLVQIPFSVFLLSHGVSFRALLDTARPLNPEFMNWSSGYLFGVELMCGLAIVRRFEAMLALCWSCCVCLDKLMVSSANTISIPLTTGVDWIVICQ